VALLIVGAVFSRSNPKKLTMLSNKIITQADLIGSDIHLWVFAWYNSKCVVIYGACFHVLIPPGFYCNAADFWKDVLG
jgi:hypothetical protein